MIARKCGAVAVVGLGLAVSLGLGSPHPAHAEACSGGTGVTVVVDYGPYGGVQTGCAPDPTNGFSALSQAGFDVVQPTMAPGVVCRIDGAPPAEDEACVRTPQETAYWSYWQAAPGSTTWTYSGTGAGSSQPRQGGSDGWAFGAGSPPGIAAPVNTAAPPPPPPPPPPAPDPTTTSARPPAPPPPSSGGGSAEPDPSTTSPGGVSTTAGAPSGSPTSPSTTAAPTGTADEPSTGEATAGAASQEVAASRDAATDPAPTARAAPWGLLLAGVAAAALAGGAFWQVRRRR
ncbi:MAG: hypothetical protein H0T66_16390 [Geodermatophilaceae bacterium]|nr:hypothetical protein [Geodermatophilaceae bacterium]